VSYITTQDVAVAMVAAVRDVGEDIARERGWVLNRQNVHLASNGEVSITWELPNGWFHRQYVALPKPYDLVDKRRARRLVPVKEQLLSQLRRYDTGGPVPWEST